MRLIKRYSNRKLYDTKESRYVTHGQLLAIVRGGEGVRVEAHLDQADITVGTLLLALAGEEGVGDRVARPAVEALVRASTAR